MLLSVDGAPLLHGTLLFPRVGPWSARITTEGHAPLTTPVTLQSDTGLTLRGSVFRSDAFHGRVSSRIVAGAGGLGAALSAKAFANVPLRLPLLDALSAGGERLAGSGAPAFTLPQWVRAATHVGAELATLADVANVPWRFLDDGTVWLGNGPWPDATTEVEELAADDSVGLRTYRASDLMLRPGTVLKGRRLTLVTYRFSPREVLVDAWS